MTDMTAPAGRARARDLGIMVGSLAAGPLNAITDVPGVRVGHTTLIEGSDIRTGVTAIVHDRLTGAGALSAGLATGNGFGKIVGTTQVSELGMIETPVVLTATLCTFRAADALVSYLLSLPGNEQLETVNPVVAETNDGFLSDMRRRPVTEEHVLAALRGATAGPVAEGGVGAGTGTSALGFKAGIGTSSRVVECGSSGGPVTIGVLVQANFGGTLTVLGVRVPPGPEQARQGAGEPGAGEPGNSCVIVLATDAPLDSRRLARVAWRSFAGMARAGSDFSGRSGDYALAFSTAPPEAGPLPDAALDPLFAAAADATEEAILNSLLAAETTAGFRGHVRHAVPLDLVRRLCAARGVLGASDQM
ncbi:MAG TPA: P1 family peptidase [Streptosporangiaceae bacterium]|nr:P1 family peptidase [Streptosporangiaceae bacterium]